MKPLDIARRVKHRAWLWQRAVRGGAFAARDRYWRAMDQVQPPQWKVGDYGGTFLDIDTTRPNVPAESLSPRVFVLWTGDNPLTPNRAAALDELRRNEQVLQVVLIDAASVSEWVLSEHPLHTAYEHLSLVHRSDYLRAYVMHYYGGAYCDLKRGYGDVAACVQRLGSSPRHWLLGYPELSSHHVAATSGELGGALRRHHGVLVGNGAFVVRPRTPLTEQWLSEVERRLDAFAPRLARHPGGVWGDDPDYPVPWGDLLGAVLQPLCLKHRDRVLADRRMMPSFTDFR